MTDIDKSLSLLDKSIDDIEDLPGFEVPPKGVYTLKMNCAIKEVNSKAAIETSFEVMEVMELNDPSEEAEAKIGTKFSVLNFIEKDIAMGKFKEMVAPIAAATGEKNVGKLVSEVIKDLVVVATVGHRKNKEDPDKPYADIGNITVA
jgi:hypothetical protein